MMTGRSDSWGSHPEPRCTAFANQRADRSGHRRRSLEWLEVYRAAYAREATDADGYLASLDARIGNMVAANAAPRGAPGLEASDGT